VILATDYDAYDDAFVDKRSMENAMFATSCSPFEGICHPIECAKSMNPTNTMFVQKGIPTASNVQGDARMDILGNFSIATVGQQADNTKIGELWIHYDLELSRPVLDQATSSFSQQYSAAAAVGGPWTFQQNTKPAGGWTATYGSGATWNYLNFDSSGIPTGTYLVVARSTTSASITGFTSPTAWYATGAITIKPNDVYDRTSGTINSKTMNDAVAEGVQNWGTAVAIVTVTGPGVLTYRSCYAGTGTVYADVFFASYNPASLSRRGRRVMDVDSDVSVLSNELKQLKMLVASIAPGAFDTNDDSSSSSASFKSPASATPQPRFGISTRIS
jgi:hypothetical protein